jgi:hypothetical protein
MSGPLYPTRPRQDRTVTSASPSTSRQFLLNAEDFFVVFTLRDSRFASGSPPVTRSGACAITNREEAPNAGRNASERYHPPLREQPASQRRWRRGRDCIHQAVALYNERASPAAPRSAATMPVTPPSSPVRRRHGLSHPWRAANPRREGTLRKERAGQICRWFVPLGRPGRDVGQRGVWGRRVKPRTERLPPRTFGHPEAALLELRTYIDG